MYKIKTYIHIVIWSIFFLTGLIETFGLFPKLLNLISLILIAYLFSVSLLKAKPQNPLWGLFILLILTTLLSGMLFNNFSMISNFYFIRRLILPQYLYFFVIINEKDDRIIKLVIKIIVFYYALQIPVSFVKFALLGNMESYIGTVSMKEGSMTTLIALVGSSYAFSRFLLERDRKYIILLFLFLLFSQIGGKRAVLVYLPIVLGGIYFYFNSFQKVDINFLLRRNIVIIILVLIFLYSIVRLNPTLNPDNRIGGRFDLDYTIAYVGKYNSRNTSHFDMTRTQALLYMFNYIIGKDLDVMLFGEGAGKLTYASGLDTKYDPIEYYYGIRYGGRMGIVWILAQVGLIGTSLYLIILWRMLRFVIKIRPPSYHNFVFFGIWLSVMIDLLTYSMSSLNYFVISGVLFTYYGMFYRDYKLDKKVLS